MAAPPLFLRPDRAFWRGRRVLVTGHTGFKGSWMTLWLSSLGAQVTGIALAPNTEPNLFDLADVAGQTTASHITDIRDAKALREIVAVANPQVVFHMAAQALVLDSYDDPLTTFSTNVQGTANFLDALRAAPDVEVAVMITTDKVYENPGDGYPFRETDPLGGHDPYSASKAASEIVIESYRRSFLDSQGVAIAPARAGNVIGGGDWCKNRLIPDAVRAWTSDTPLEVRSPAAIRPWQHVLEPLAGYLCLAEKLAAEPKLAGSYNFGPQTHEAATVRDVLTLARKAFGRGDIQWNEAAATRHEAGWLSLETTKARHKLGLVPRWSLQEGVSRTMNWYRQQNEGADAKALCVADIDAFEAAKSQERIDT